RLGGDPVHLHWHVLYPHYLDTLGLNLTELAVDPVIVDAEWELGVGFSKGDRPLKLRRLELERIGLSYRFGDDGEFSGVGIFFKSLFDR
ncbi:MAG: hypothetical protein R3305_04470, partial [Gammaproteobacteria bacterium]|nr:hypothetical protein [Gammaproteobacteria bacterium]